MTPWALNVLDIATPGKSPESGIIGVAGEHIHGRTLNSQNGRHSAQTGATWARHRVSNTTVLLLEGSIPGTVRASCLGTDRRILAASSAPMNTAFSPLPLDLLIHSIRRLNIPFSAFPQGGRSKQLSKLSVRYG